MRPHRVRLTHSLVSNYGLNSKMYVHRPYARSKEEIEEFHCDGESIPLFCLSTAADCFSSLWYAHAINKLLKVASTSKLFSLRELQAKF